MRSLLISVGREGDFSGLVSACPRVESIHAPSLTLNVLLAQLDELARRSESLLEILACKFALPISLKLDRREHTLRPSFEVAAEDGLVITTTLTLRSPAIVHSSPPT